MTATFDLSRNIDLALQDTQAKIAQMQRSLPTSAQPPTVSKSNPDDQPIVTLGVSGPFSRQLLADVARYQVQDMLETIPGVGQIQMMGYLDRNIRIWVDAEKLVATAVTVTDITSALKAQHVTMPGGELDNGGMAFDVRVVGEAADLVDASQHRRAERRAHAGATEGRGARRGRLPGRDQPRAGQRRARSGDGHPQAAGIERGRRRERRPRVDRQRFRRRCPRE